MCLCRPSEQFLLDLEAIDPVKCDLLQFRFPEVRLSELHSASSRRKTQESPLPVTHQTQEIPISVWMHFPQQCALTGLLTHTQLC